MGSFDATIKNECIHIDLSIIEERIADCPPDLTKYTSLMTLCFSSPQRYDRLSEYYLYVHDFLQFISFRGNIAFDSVELLKKDETQHSTKIADAYYNVRDNTKRYSRNGANVITYHDLGSSASKLFEYVAQRRTGYIVDSLDCQQQIGQKL